MTLNSAADPTTNPAGLNRRVTAGAILVVAMFVSLLPVPALASQDTVVEVPGNGPFLDDDGSVFETDIAALAEAGITSGCAVGRYCPDEHITRAQMAAFLRRALPDLPVVSQSTAFSDISESVFADDITWLAQTGVTRGCASDRFCPDQPVTRGQMAAFLRRAFASRVTPTLPPVEFIDTTDSVFADDIAWLAQAGITRGCDDDRFCPGEPVTRAQMAAFLRRAAGLPEGTITNTIMWDLRVPTGPGAEGWRLLVSHFFQPQDVDRAVRVIFCESSGDPNAVNRRSSATGLFQHLPRYWLERASEVPEAGQDMFDPVANTAVAAWLVYEGGGWSHWYPSEYCWG